MEHVGKHCENGDEEVREDAGLREWALREGIVRIGKKKGALELVTNPRTGRRGGGGGGNGGAGAAGSVMHFG